MDSCCEQKGDVLLDSGQNNVRTSRSGVLAEGTTRRRAGIGAEPSSLQ
jgi:hypothetical protein